MNETDDDWVSEALRFADESRAEMGVEPSSLRPRRTEAFLKGPVSLSWVTRAATLPGASLVVALAIRFLRDRYPKKTTWSTAEIGWRVGREEQAARRALRSLSRAGLIAMDRRPGNKPTLVFRDLPDSEDPGYPLWGPIPWRWWRAVSSLPGKAPQVGLACWLQAGWDRSACFELASSWPTLGLSRSSMYRGLACLEKAGLIAVKRHRKRAPIVALLDHVVR
jgi:predicted transcriptional regulator